MSGETPPHAAVPDKSSEQLELLLRRTSNIAVDDINDDGRTPLHCAAFNSSAATVTVLLERGGDKYAKDSDERTPLHLAALQG
jgi:ankyrin repeat protein